MKTQTILRILGLFFALDLFTSDAHADNPVPVCDSFYTTSWVPGTMPTINGVYAVPEPGLTNETMTIFGEVSTNPGTIDEVFTYYNCSDYQVTNAFPWPIVTSSLSWETHFTSGTLLDSGSFTPVLMGFDNISFVSPQSGDEEAWISIMGEATNEYTAYVSPVNYPLYIPFSVLPRQRLAYFSFDNTSLAGDRGQLPTIATNISLFPSPFGTGVDFDKTNGIHLEYSAFQDDVFSVTEIDTTTNYSTGSPNIRRNEGTVQFWFQPDWSNGYGPTNGGIFVDIISTYGTETWTLAVVTNSGATIKLNNAGGGFSQPVSFSSNLWYQVAVTYSPTQTVLYTNGIMAGSAGTGVSSVSADAIGSIRVGSDGTNEQVRGIMDELKTYNYAMNSSEVLSNYQAEYSIDTDGAGVPNVVQFESGIAPSDPPGGNPNPITPTNGIGAPVIHLLEPINAVEN